MIRWLAIGLLLLPIPAVAAERMPVRTTSGLVQGILSQDRVTISYKGLPFAAPPVGILRWAPPQPPKSWTDVRQADRFGPDCPQPRQGGAQPLLNSMAEDCLTLNIWKPTGGLRPLPVMLWIFGGSFVAGSTADPRFNGEAIARQGVILITVNYRLGALGYLAHPALSKSSPTGASGNYGVMDNIAALRWVHQNIAQFGGDPKRVTVFGQSSGGVSVNMLLAAPTARGLLVGGIVQSGPLFGLTPTIRDRATAEAFGKRFMDDRGAYTVDAMRLLPWQSMLVLTPDEKKTMLLPFAPIADGALLPESSIATFQHGTENPVPLIIGSTAQENASSAPLHVTPAMFEAWAKETYGERADHVLALWPHTTDAQARQSRIQARAYAINEGTQYEALLHARNQRETFEYRFDRPTPGPNSALYGADHGSDVAYTFGNLDPAQHPWTVVDTSIKNDLMGYWLNFAKRGDPNGPGLPHWPRVGIAPGMLLIFSDTRHPETVDDIERLHASRRANDAVAAPLIQ